MEGMRFIVLPLNLTCSTELYRIIDSGSSHFVGDTVKFSCNRNFLLVGQPEISCTDDGTWSHLPPHCEYTLVSVLVFKW